MRITHPTVASIQTGDLIHVDGKTEVVKSNTNTGRGTRKLDVWAGKPIITTGRATIEKRTK